MKRNIGKYKKVELLPKNAMAVKEYADSKGFTTPYIYKLVSSGKNDTFEIVIYKGYNFIIPIN